MTPAENSSAPQRRPSPGPGARPYVEETTIKTSRLQVERKLFILTLKENPRGRFLRITEDANSRRVAIIIPASGLEAFVRSLQELAAANVPPEPAGPPPV